MQALGVIYLTGEYNPSWVAYLDGPFITSLSGAG